MKQPSVIFWHRRDLRVHDNHGLYHALNSGYPVRPIFIFDTNILNKLESRSDQRVLFIHDQLKKLKQTYQRHNSDLEVYFGSPEVVFNELIKNKNIQGVYTNNDYEPYARSRDEKIKTVLDSESIPFRSFKDHVLFEKHEVLKVNLKPYTIYTPYSKAWKTKLKDNPPVQFYSESLLDRLLPVKAPKPLISLSEFGFQDDRVYSFPPISYSDKLIRDYSTNREFPAQNGTTKLSVHLRFGTISIRQLVNNTSHLSETFLNELIWRDFYQMILFHFPESAKQSFRKQYDTIDWENNEVDFDAWCKGKTGYPIVDAGMRELNATGFMHNRVRMITASFLTKHLLIDWRWGEAYFAEKLLDYDLASNVGGWQWASGSGCDAAPYFRVFNPYLQQEKFDPDFKYIKKWVPEYGSESYPKPIIEHSFARNRAIERYKKALKK